MKKTCWMAAGALLMLGASPCLAADDMRDIGNTERRSAAFAGGSFNVPLGSRQVAKPKARLQLGIRHIQQDSTARTPTQIRQVGLVELGGGGGGKPALFISGQNVTQIEKRLGLIGTTGTLLLIGGIAIGAYAAVKLLDDNDTRCLDPSRCD